MKGTTGSSGIVSYGAYVPRYRIKVEEIARVWGKPGKTVAANLNVFEKSVPGFDEDTATISVEAARQAVERVDLDPTKIGAIYVGSESHPYAVKPTGTIVAEALGTGPHLTMADYEFACKAGTAAIQTCMGLVKSGMVEYGLAIGTDTSQGAPSNALEYSASAGGAALLIGAKEEELIATLNDTCSFTTDTPDFWRREGQKYPSHGERFTGKPAFFRHITMCAQRLMQRVGKEAPDYDYAVFHQPNGKFPKQVARQLGFTDEQTKDGLLAPMIGNTYSGAVLIGLARILDKARAGSRILMVAYGSGAGSDAFDITVTSKINDYRAKLGRTVEKMIEDKAYIDYATYAKVRGKIVMGGAG